MPTATRENETSVVKRFSQVSASEFRIEVDELWKAASEIMETISKQVEQQRCSPVQGAGMLSCTTGQLFGYAEFHGLIQPNPLALLHDGERR